MFPHTCVSSQIHSTPFTSPVSSGKEPHFDEAFYLKPFHDFHETHISPQLIFWLKQRLQKN